MLHALLPCCVLRQHDVKHSHSFSKPECIALQVSLTCFRCTVKSCYRLPQHAATICDSAAPEVQALHASITELHQAAWLNVHAFCANAYLDIPTCSIDVCVYLRLHLAARIVSSGPVRHVKSQGQDVICLVSGIMVTQCHSSLSICSDRTPVLCSADGPLSYFLRQLLQHPHFLLLIPLGPVHDLHAHWIALHAHWSRCQAIRLPLRCLYSSGS